MIYYMWLSLVPLIFFLIIITTIFYKILLSTESLLIFLVILYAFYIIFRYVMRQVEYVNNPQTIPLVTADDLGRYTLESGVELRELQENFSDIMPNNEMKIIDDEDDSQ